MLLKIGLCQHLFERDLVGSPGIDRLLLGLVKHFPSNRELDLSFHQLTHEMQLVLMISRVVVCFADINPLRFPDPPPECFVQIRASLASLGSRPRRTRTKKQTE